MKRNLLAVFIFICFCAASQNKKMDSLQTLFNNSKTDTARLRLYYYLSEACDTKDNLKYTQPALKLVDKLLSVTKDSVQRDAILRQQTQLKMWAVEYYSRIDGSLLKRLEYLKEALADAQKLNYKRGMSRYMVQLQFLYADLGDTATALLYLDKATALEKEIADTSRLARGYYITGVSYFKMKRYDEAIKYYYKAIDRFEIKKDTLAVADLYLNIGDALIEKGQFDKGMTLLQKALNLVQLAHNLDAEMSILTQIGSAYKKRGEIAKAIELHQKVFTFFKNSNKEGEITEISFFLTGDYIALKDFKKAKQYASPLYKLLERGLPLDVTQEVTGLVYQIDSALGNGKEAFKYYQQYISAKEKLNNKEVVKKAAQEKFQRDFDNQKAEQQKKDLIAASESRKQKVVTAAVALGLLLVVIFAVFVMRSLRVTKKQKQIIEVKSKETEEQKNIIEEKNRDITDSITYAKRIQQAKLPKREEIISSLPDSFILFKPKDIVSGDFYFFHKKSQSVFIAAVDCTGHGVPGAFMSMIGSDKLEDAVSQSSDTSEILKLLNKGIKTSLRQSDTNESTRDGMDIALCMVDTTNHAVKFAGANRPFYLVRKGQAEVEEIKATKKAIGGLTEDNQHFDTHELKLQKGDVFYISTDGYADQFSGQDKKLTTKKFKQILLEIQDKPMKEQGEYLDSYIENWKTGMEQIDDILVIGVRM